MKRYHVAAGTYIISDSQEMILNAVLGTCVGLALYDKQVGIGGIAHLLLAEPVSSASATPEKYASTGVPLFLDALVDKGAIRENLKGCIAGGALVSPVSELDLSLDIGGRTTEKVKSILHNEKIMIEASETGGFFTSRLELNTKTWETQIEPVGQDKLFKYTENTVPAKKEITSTIENIKPIPQVALKLLRIINEESYDISNISKEVLKDQVLGARTLQICNSPLVGASRKFESLDQALVFLGENQFVKLVLLEAVRNYFNQSGMGYSLCKGGMYYHAFGTAMISEKVAEESGQVNPQAAYTAGLLHDIGKVVLDQHIKSAYPMFYRKFHEEKNQSIKNIEKDIFGIDHTEIGALLADRWSFSDSLASVVKFHHNPGDSKEHRELTNAVYIADLLMLQFNSSLEIERIDGELIEKNLEAIGLSKDQYQKLVDLIPLEVFSYPTGPPNST